MKLSKLTKELFFKTIAIIAIILTVVIVIFAAYNGRQYVSRRGVRHVVNEIRDFGNWAPVVLSGLILLNTLVPPIPIPIPLIEIAAGSVFGFWPGFILIWLTQIVSSIAAYFLSKSVSRLFLKKILKSRFYSYFDQLIKKRGAFAIFVIRATMIAPFNISFVAGLSDMPLLKFIPATILGVISESAIFSYIGTLLVQRVRFRLWYVFVILAVISVLPTAVFLLTKILSHKKSKSNQ